MTSKMHQKVTSVLAGVAIAVLLAIIIVVWVQVGHGAFRSQHHYLNNTTVDEIAQKNNIEENIRSSFVESKDARKETVRPSHLDDLGQHTDVEFVKPLKTEPPPLHDHDIIYDQLHNAQDHPILRHHSGHFRHKAAEVWDPHPQYEINAFGRTFELELMFNDKFVSPNLQVTHIWENYTLRAMHDPRTSGCFYTGKVKGEENSDVAVSLCNGMTGYIRTSEGNYYIEPIENFHRDSGTTILHRIKKLYHKVGIANNDVVEEVHNLCDTKENTTVIHDDLETKEHSITKRNVMSDFHDLFEEGRTVEHTITKRIVPFDYLDTSADDYKKHRSVRDASREDKSFNFVPANQRSGNQEYHIETMIVADKIMARYHNTDEDLIHYILTLMSHVALLFKDVTIGNPISLAVVKIWILKEIEFTSQTSEEMLRKFCEWQTEYNTKHQHDIALLLTRESICNSTSKICNTLGVAEVGSMCSPTSSCAIVRDQGLSTSYTIAHELGHVLSMPHDDDNRCVMYNGKGNANIMSKALQNDTKPWLWSACSRHFLTEFLESNKATCLFEPPNMDFITSKFVKMLPGETFDVDEQCDLEFGSGYKLCPYSEMATCASLWCTLDDFTGCKTQHMPWADGTECGDLSWCYHGKCIPLNRTLLQPIPGQWGEWKEWGPCSRTCGGGVKMARRECDSPPPANGGAYCRGRSVKYTSCNYQPCDSKAPNFREVQCAEFNGMTKGILGLTNDVKWIPKYGMDEPEDFCKLYCRVQHSSAYYMLKEKVVDGTKCGLNRFDICVNGVCHKAGCDNRLDSEIALDECGVCGGDNSECQNISGTYNVSSYGYNRVIRLPKGSSNIYIRQRGYGNSHADDNFLALVDGETGNYVLNGNFVVSSFLKDVIFGGMTITYSGSEKVIEHITTPKNRKLTKDLVLEVLSIGKLLPPDITYRYTIKKKHAPRYNWQLHGQHVTKCSSICNGTQSWRPLCMDLLTSRRVPDTYCKDIVVETPPDVSCNTHCNFMWNIKSRGQCSSQCGSGVRQIYYNCVKVNSNEADHHRRQTLMNERHCAIIPKPVELEACEGTCDLTHWQYDEWSQCTKTCGGGIQRRAAQCLDRRDQIVNDFQCNENEKVVEQICNHQKCPVWSFDDWTPCSVTCGKGYRTRPFYCHVDGHSFNPNACNSAELPVLQKECNERPCVQWSTENWQECNVSCGGGVQERKVVCRTTNSEVVDDDYCRDLLKPNDTRSCNENKCENLAPYKREYNIITDFEDNSIIPQPRVDLKFKWVTGAWSKCTKPCATGSKSRMVVCRNIYGDENEYECDHYERPIHSVECNAHACPVWNFGGWSDCDVNCEQHRQVSCQNATGEIVEDEQCDLNIKPYKLMKCNSGQCGLNDKQSYFNIKENRDKRFKWKIGRWGKCSESCGRGIKIRPVRCTVNVNVVTVVDQYCNHLKKPKTRKQCERNNCDYVWVEGAWSQCSQTCGEGFKIRNVSCHRVMHGGFVDPNPLPEFSSNTVPYNYCNLHGRPPNKSTCIERNCNDLYSWSTGPWGQCSHQCGKKGRQIRNLYCTSANGIKVKQRFCSKVMKPRKKRKCNRKKCIYRSCKEIKHAQHTMKNNDYYLSIENKTAFVHCYKMDTSEPEEYISLKYDHQNFAEMYDKSLNDRDSCPNSGERYDYCDCTPLGPERSGYTMFWKVRLNITSMKIIGDDFTFSRQINGKKIAYGTSGDCYSNRERCIQGRFSIDLTDTSFRLSKNVRWINTGNQASSRIDMQDRVVRGTCGGYCGNCIPDTNIGLLVEVT